MKTFFPALVAAALCVIPLSSDAQPGRGGPGGSPKGTQFSGGMRKLFGEHQAFSATLENRIKMDNEEMSVPGKVAFDTGKSRFEMDMTEAKSRQMTPEMVEQLKLMGMDKMVMISRPDQKSGYMIYPGLQAYVVIPIQDPDADKPESAFKIETTELGKETVEGHPTVKSKAVVTDDKGEKKEFTVWTATDLKKFPIKIESTEQGNPITMTFKDVKLGKPQASLFDPPADFKKYTNPMQLQEQIMMRAQQGAGAPGAPARP